MAGVENFAIPSDEENEDVVVEGDEGPVFLTVKKKKKKKKGYDVPSRYITYSEADELGKLEALRQTVQPRCAQLFMKLNDFSGSRPRLPPYNGCQCPGNMRETASQHR